LYSKKKERERKKRTVNIIKVDELSFVCDYVHTYVLKVKIDEKVNHNTGKNVDTKIDIGRWNGFSNVMMLEYEGVKVRAKSNPPSAV